MSKQTTYLDPDDAIPKKVREPEKEGRWMTLVPAYGRDYKTAEDVLKDWLAGKDFQIQDVSWEFNGRYISIRDALEGGSCENITFKIRFLRRTAFVLIQNNKIVGTSADGEF
jgi:hypothetical protein